MGALGLGDKAWNEVQGRIGVYKGRGFLTYIGYSQWSFCCSIGRSFGVCLQRITIYEQDMEGCPFNRGLKYCGSASVF